MPSSANQSDAVGGRFVWLASYPKSGNTWLRLMLHSLCNGGRQIDINEFKNIAILNRSEFEEHFGVKSSDLTQSEVDAVRPDLHHAIARTSKETPIYRKVHDCCWINPAGQRVFPPEISRGAVYIVRDPRDVTVSYAHHFNVSLEESVRRMGDANSILAKSIYKLNTQLAQPLGSWSGHVVSWLDHAAMPVLLVRYEDMLADSGDVLMRVATFLELPEAAVPDACAKAAAAADFATLQSQEDEHGFREKSPTAEKFFRRGGSGEGKEVLPGNLLRKIESDHGAVMKRLGYL